MAATGQRTQLTRQIGEHLVTAELGRRGYVASPFAGNVPMFDILAANQFGDAVPIQVKTINGPSWQFAADTFLEIEIVDGEQIVKGKKALPRPDLLCIFVLLKEPGTDEFFIFYLRDLQDHFAEHYKGGRRPKNPQSMHCAIWPKELAPFKGNWDLMHRALRA
jgi:hypothetical protein